MASLVTRNLYRVNRTCHSHSFALCKQVCHVCHTVLHLLGADAHFTRWATWSYRAQLWSSKWILAIGELRLKLENQIISPCSAKNTSFTDENAREISHIFFEWEEIISILCLGRSLEHFVSLQCTFTDFLC